MYIGTIGEQVVPKMMYIFHIYIYTVCLCSPPPKYHFSVTIFYIISLFIASCTPNINNHISPEQYNNWQCSMYEYIMNIAACIGHFKEFWWCAPSCGSPSIVTCPFIIIRLFLMVVILFIWIEQIGSFNLDFVIQLYPK